jgi:hypothetical protein
MKCNPATLLACLLLSCGTMAFAQQPYLEQRVEDLEKEVRTLRERLDKLERAPAPAASIEKKRPAYATPIEEVNNPPPAQPPARWNKIKVGMTQIQVTQLVGEPETRNGDRQGERWTFGSGYVDFDAVGEVSGWKAPQ